MRGWGLWRPESAAPCRRLGSTSPSTAGFARCARAGSQQGRHRLGALVCALARLQRAIQGAGALLEAVSLEQARYSEMIDQLEQVLEEGRSVLAPETLVSIDEALRTVDEAISEIETALAEDPNSDLLLRLLTTHQNTKLGVLQRAAGAVQSQT